MAQVGSGTAGKVLVAKGTGASPKFEDIGTDSGLTSNGLVVSKGTSAFVATSALTDGQVVIGRSGNTPIAANLTAGSGVSITNGSGSITIGLSGGGAAIDSITNDSGTTPVVPDVNGNLNLLGSGSITTVGSTNTSTFQLTGLTQYNVLAGAGTTTIQKIAPSATSGVALISQGSSAYPVFGTTVVAGGGTGTTSFNTNGVVISNTTSTGALSSLSLTNGQIVIGSTAGAPAAATITGTSPILVTNGANSIAIAVNGGGFAWTVVTGTSQTVFARSGFIANNNSSRVMFTMNAVNSGDASKVVGHGSAGWRLTPTSTQRIYLGNSVTTATTGYIESTNVGDAVETVAVSTTEIRVTNWVGNPTVV